MSGTANVRSIDALKDFRAALLVFSQQVNDALITMQDQTMHALDWVENDRPRYWRQSVLDSHDLIAAKRVELEQAMLRKSGFDHRPSLIEEKEALAAAKRRLAYCQQKVQIVKQTGIELRHESDEFVGRMSQLLRLVETDLPKMVAMLEHMVLALEKYSEVAKSTSDDGSEI